MFEARCAELVDKVRGRANPLNGDKLSPEARVRMALLAVWKLRGYETSEIDWVNWLGLEVGWGDSTPQRKTDLWRGGRLSENPFHLKDLEGWARR